MGPYSSSKRFRTVSGRKIAQGGREDISVNIPEATISDDILYAPRIITIPVFRRLSFTFTTSRAVRFRHKSSYAHHRKRGVIRDEIS